MNLNKRILEVFNDSQDVTYNHNTGIEILREVFQSAASDSSKQDENRLSLLHTLADCIYILAIDKNDHRTHYSVDFLVDFLIEFNKTEEETYIQFELINFLAKHLKVNSEAARHGICTIIYKLLLKLKTTPTSDLDIRLFLKLQINLVERLRDPNKNIQILAIKSAAFLQTPNDRDCPVVNAFLNLIKHESLPDIRLLIVKSIVITNEMFYLFKDWLIYDSNECVSTKVLDILMKNMPESYYSEDFRWQIVEILIRNKQFELLEKFVQKWSKQNCDKGFLKCLDIGSRYLKCEQLRTNFLDEKIGQLMNLYFNQYTIYEIIAEFNHLLATSENLSNDLELCVHIRFLLEHCRITKKETIVSQHLSLKSQDLFKIILAKLSASNGTSIDSYISYNLIHAYFSFCKVNIECIDKKVLTTLIEAVNPENENIILVIDLILNRFTEKSKVTFMEELYMKFLSVTDKDLPTLFKFMTLITCFMSKLSQDDYEILDANDQNIAEILTLKVALGSVVHLEPKIRAMSVRIIGLASVVCYTFAESYIALLLQILVVDYAEVVLEVQKALYNIFLHYPSANSFDPNTWEKCINCLEEQLDVNNPEIKFIAYEGFAKLLLINSSIPKKKILLMKLLLAYFRRPTQTNDLENTSDNKLKACLSAFFDNYTDDCFFELTVPLLKIALNEPKWNMSLRSIAKFFYFHSTKTKNQPLLVMSLILDQINNDINNYPVNTKWIELLLEFNIHQSDLDSMDSKLSVKMLSDLLYKMNSVIDKFKKEKWYIKSEKDIGDLMARLRRLIRDNGGQMAGKRKAKVICETGEEANEIFERQIKERKTRET